MAIVFIISIQLYSIGENIQFLLLYRIVTDITIFYINYLILVPLLLLKNKKTIYFFLVIVLIFISYFIFKYFIPVPNNAPDFVKKRPLIVFTIMHIIIGITIRIYDVWNSNEIKKKEIELQKNASELQNLKNQLNPHFLFNSLNSIYSLTAKKSDDAPEAVITLSELLRYMLYQTNDDFVPLQQELDYIKNYIKLQRLRIANNENIKINIRGAISVQKIRPLLFISFIENAFKYGTDFSGNTEIKIEISVYKSELQFKCINLIGSRNNAKNNFGIGIKNTKERLQILYPEKHSLLIAEEKNRYIIALNLKLD